MGDVRVAVCLSLRLRRDFRVQHSYCFSLIVSVSIPAEGTSVLVLGYYRHPGGASPLRMSRSPRAHKHRACVETQCGWSSSVNDLCPSRRLELMGAGGKLGSMAAWEHSDGISHDGYSASANWQ